MAPAGKGEVEATLESELENEVVERLEEYLGRGRRLQPLWNVDLIDGWVSIMNHWADGSTDFSDQNLDDYESEMILRGIEPPFDRVEERLAAAEAKFETNLQKFRDIAKQSKH
jgi:hypothetical protein